MREAFENDGLPQTIFIKDGKPYYMPWNAVGFNRMLEFMIRYDEICIDAFEELHPIPSGVSIYLEYYKKNIGWGFRHIEYFLNFVVFPVYEHFDPEAPYWPRDKINQVKFRYWDSHPKTGGKRAFVEILLPAAIVLILLCGCCCRCCCRKKVDEKDKVE